MSLLSWYDNPYKSRLNRVALPQDARKYVQANYKFRTNPEVSTGVSKILFQDSNLRDLSTATPSSAQFPS
jgi:hypothetical protein